MPQYFDPNNLTPEQQGRWDLAMAEYVRVQEANLDRELDAMSPEEQAEILAMFREHAPGDTRSLREHLKAWRGLMGNQAGHPKSALFARLLNGKPALPFPPPTSYSYPWYAVVEESGPFNVSLGGVPTVSGRLRGTGGIEGQFAIGFNQCMWAVISLNDAARRLMELQDALSATAAPEKEGSLYERHTWTPNLLEGVLAAYAAGPEFIVRHGRWAEYRLRIGRNESVCQRQYLKEEVDEIANRQCGRLSTCGNVFDVRRFFLNPDVGEGGEAQTDFVRLICDDWVLEKALIRAPFTADEVQRLNEWQTQTGGGLPVHPFTCGNRGDGKHGKEGGDTGVLIATEAGWVCPHCEYTQDWAHPMMAALQPTFVAVFGSQGHVLISGARRALEVCLPAYQALAAAKKPGAVVMVECLRRRAQELEAEAAKPSEPLAMWTIYDHPSDCPEFFVARRWLLVSGNPNPQLTNEVLMDETLEGLRSQLPPGLVKMPREQGDDPVIVETWL